MSRERLLAGLVVAHGLAHGAGVAGNLALARTHGTTHLLGGWWPTSDPAVLVGSAVLWALLGVAMVLTGVLIVTGARAASRVLLVVAAASLLMCVVSLMAAEVGVAVNLGLLAAAATGFANRPQPTEAEPASRTSP
jgi:hypothetical protein